MRSRLLRLSSAIATTLLAVLLLLPAGDGNACIHPRKGTAPVVQVSQEAIILHHDGVQDLILRVGYQSTGAGSLASLTPGDGKVTGGCEKDSVLRVLKKRMAPLRYCYVKGLKRNPDIAGDLTLRWTIGAKGRASDLAVASDTLSDPQVNECVTRNLSRARFASHEHGSCTAEWPLAFTTKAKDAKEEEGLAWVVPIPSRPMDYEKGENKAFEELAAWAAVRRAAIDTSGMKGVARSRSADVQQGDLTLLPRAKIGPFWIQPVRGTGTTAATSLNKWLDERGYGTMPKEELAYYIDRGWTFLAIKITTRRGRNDLDDKGRLPPLKVTFESERAVYPLKLSTNMGEFGAKVTLFTAEKLPQAAFQGAINRGFEVVTAEGYFSDREDKNAPLEAKNTTFKQKQTPRALKADMRGRFGRLTKTLHMSVLINEHINTNKGRSPRLTSEPANWSEDLSVPGLADGQRLEQR